MAEQAEEMRFSLDRGEPNEMLARKMATVGFFEETPTFGFFIFKLAAYGITALAEAKAQGVKTVSWPENTSSFQIHQNVHGGTSNTQIGNHNTMQVHVAGIPPEQLLAQFNELRALVNTLPEDDQEEALSLIDNAERAVKKGAFERLQTYGPLLLNFATKSMEFVEKVKTTFGI